MMEEADYTEIPENPDGMSSLKVILWIVVALIVILIIWAFATGRLP